MHTFLTHLYGTVAAAYVTTSLVVAAIRWFHMCRPFDRNPRYYYPGRPFVTLSFLSALTLIPYALFPEDYDAWFLVRLYFLPVALFSFTLMLSSYFGRVMEWKKWKWPIILASLPVILSLLSALLAAVLPGEQLRGTALPGIVLYTLGALTTVACLTAIAVVRMWAGCFDPDDFSNPADFPVTQARRWVVIALVDVALCWTGALLNNPCTLAVIQLMMAGLSVHFVLTALHPNRNRPLAEETPAADAPDVAAPAQARRPLPKKKQAEMLAAIREVVEGQQAFLEAHLTLQDVADRCGYGRTYISTLIKEEMGGFSAYVNRLRLAYVEEYLQAHPEATLGEAIDMAGFGSRPTYYHMRQKLAQE